MKKLLLLMLLGAPPLWAAEAALEQGELYAVVEVLPDGEIDVVQIHGLPEDLHPEIELWLKDQAIQLAVSQTDEAPSRTTVQIAYTLIEDAEGGGKGLALDLVASGVSVPAEPPPPVTTAEIPVRVQVSSEGRVEWIRPERALPEGVSMEALQARVREDIENDPEVRRAAAEGRLEARTYTITVRLKPRD